MCKTWKFFYSFLVLTVLLQSCRCESETSTLLDEASTLLDGSSTLLDESSTLLDQSSTLSESTTADAETSPSFVESPTMPSKSPKLKKLLRVFSNRLEATILAEETERHSTRLLTSEFQLNLVKKMTDYRLQMVVHRNHSFGQNFNEKWIQCLNTKSKIIKELEDTYSENESGCVQIAQKEVTQQKQAVRQIVKETRKWRKGYRYLHYLCKENNPSDKESAGACFVDYMQKDKYDDTITRLLILLDKAQSELEKQIEETNESFDVCLQKSLSSYLEGVRSVMDQLNKCYKRKISAFNSRAENNTGCDKDFSKLKCINLLS